ncbi:MAG: CHAT domain-containing protein, partial [Anaerolineae bacterium]
MSAAPKVTFQLTAHGDELEVRATAPGGECRAEGPLPSREQIDPLVADPTWISGWQLQTIGQTLYRSLLCGDVVQLASSVLDAGRREGQPVHFELRFDADQAPLAQYPWEMIADDLGRFLVRDGLVDVTRYITYPQPPPVLDATIRDLPLLRVLSQPAGLPVLAPIDLPLGNVETLAPATFERLQQRLLIERMALWGLHFDGHGRLISLPDGRQTGALAFEHNGDVEWITTEHLASVLYNAHVQLALLLACETAQVGDDLIFSGLAPGLILAGVPAVVGMQYPVPDNFANGFVRSFYLVLLQRQDLLEAFRVARQMNVGAAWYSPVLYLRTRRPPAEEEALKPAYQARNIDTAGPSEVQAGTDVLVRLWIRRPETQPLTDAALREELDVPDSVPIRTREAEADVKFEPLEGRKLRRGEVEVRLRSPNCEVTPGRMTLFVDEHLDAPPAIFTVRASQIGRASLLFSVWQEGGQIASLVHHLQVSAAKGPPGA